VTCQEVKSITTEKCSLNGKKNFSEIENKLKREIKNLEKIISSTDNFRE